MVRSAAKWRDWPVLTDASQYGRALAELQAGGLAAHPFRAGGSRLQPHQQYDATTTSPPSTSAAPRRVPRHEFPGQSNGRFVKRDLRYGENPHQSAAFYHDHP